MNDIKNFLKIRLLLFIFAVFLTTTNLRAQTVSQNLGESPEAIKTENNEITRGADKTAKKNSEIDEDTADNKSEGTKSEKTELEKQTDPKPPRFGGHVGIVIPIVTRGNSMTTTIADDFIIGFPFALTVRTNSPAAFDFEFVPIINTPSNQDFRFLVHPGVVYSIKKKYAVGIRAAYEFGTGNYGFTPIANRSFKLTGKLNYFIEADFPVRWERRPNRTRFASIQFAVHSGISF
ncbi:MAG: hypothetical protein M3033_03845 [Acidobacteriota bacterium]|nr:hypothetical protein [Acidobacteriota bacterium]